MYVLIATY